MKISAGLILVILFTVSCQNNSDDDKMESSFSVFCEMVSNGAKPIALSNPMPAEEADQLWDEFQEIATNYDVQLYREDNFPESTLFSASVTENKTVILIYKGDRLTQYMQWKEDLKADPNGVKSMKMARRFGRLLGYDNQGINDLLRTSVDYHVLTEYKVETQITHLYYSNVEQAIRFYSQTLGLAQIDSGLFQISRDVYLQVNPLSADHPKGQPKSTAIALLTNQLPEWYAHLNENRIPIKYTYKPKEGGPHDGFVAVDPEGYLLEFEQFKQHPENELFMAALAGAEPVVTSINSLNFIGSITWTYHKDLLKMQQFYEEDLGFRLVADQGWTKIYQTSNAGFIGLVDQCRGMENYADKKAVEIVWGIRDFERLGLNEHTPWSDFVVDNNQIIGPEGYRYNLIDSKFD